METEELFGKTIKGSISLVNDPFKQNCIENIHIHALRSIFDYGYSFTGTVEFRNGNTRGEQRFVGKDLADVYNQIAEFCTTLE